MIRVKPLTWRETWGGVDGRRPVWRAAHSFGGCFVSSAPLGIDNHADAPPSWLEAAKGKQEAAYQKRILGMIEPATCADAARLLLADANALYVMGKAARESCAPSAEGAFPPLFELLDFSGENKTRLVVNAAIYDALNAL